MSINFNSEEFRSQNIVYNLIEQDKPEKAKKVINHILKMEPSQRPEWWNQASERIKIILSSADHNAFLEGYILDDPTGVEQNTPLHFAAQQQGATEQQKAITVKKLLNLGASLFTKNIHGKTAFQAIRENLPQSWTQIIDETEEQIPIEYDSNLRTKLTKFGSLIKKCINAKDETSAIAVFKNISKSERQFSSNSDMEKSTITQICEMAIAAGLKDLAKLLIDEGAVSFKIIALANEHLDAASTEELLQVIYHNRNISWVYLELLYNNNMAKDAAKAYQAISAISEQNRPRQWQYSHYHSEFFNKCAENGTPCIEALPHCDLTIQHKITKKTPLMYALELHLHVPLLQLVQSDDSRNCLKICDKNGKSAAQYLVEMIDSTTLESIITQWNMNRSDTAALVDALLKAKKHTLVTDILSKRPDLRENDQTQLFCTAAANDYPITAFEEVSYNELNVWHKDSSGKTPLNYAIDLNRRDLIVRFLTHGASLNSKNNNGTTVAEELLAKYNESGVAQLLEEVQRANPAQYIRCLFEMGKKEQAKAILNPLLQRTIVIPNWWNNINNRTELYITLLLANENQAARQLKAQGIDLEMQQEAYHKTRLEIATELQKDPERVVLLIQEGASVSYAFNLEEQFGEPFVEEMYKDWDLSRPDTKRLLSTFTNAKDIFTAKAVRTSNAYEKANLFFALVEKLNPNVVTPLIKQFFSSLHFAERDETGKSVLRVFLENSSVSILDPTSVSYFTELGITENTLRQLDTSARQENTTSGKKLLRYIEETFCTNNSNPLRARKKLEILLKSVPHTSQAETDYFVDVAANSDLTIKDKQELLTINLPNLDRLRQFPDKLNKNLLMIAADSNLGGEILKNLLSKQKDEQLNQTDRSDCSALRYLINKAQNDFEPSFFSDWYANCSLQQAYKDLYWLSSTTYIQQVMTRLDSASAASRPADWNTKNKSLLFMSYISNFVSPAEIEPILLYLLPNIDQTERWQGKTPLMIAAKEKLPWNFISRMDLSLERLTAIDENGCPSFIYLLDNIKNQLTENFITNFIDELPLDADFPSMLTALYTHNHPELGQRLLHRLMEWSPPFGRGLWWNTQTKTDLFFSILPCSIQQGADPSHIHDLILLAPYINHASVNSLGHIPLFEALNTSNKDLVSLLIINGSKLSPIIDNHSLLYHLQQKFGEPFATSIIENISLHDRTDIYELLPQLIQEGLTSTAEKIITRIQTTGDAEQKTKLFFALAPLQWDRTKKAEALTALLPALNLTQKDSAHTDQTVLMSAIAYTELPITDLINRYPLDNPVVVDEICLLFKSHKPAYAHQLLGRLLALSQENRPSWFNREAKTKLFFAEAKAIGTQSNQDYRHDLVVLAPDIDPNAFDNALFIAIESRHEELVTTLLTQGAHLYAMQENNSAFAQYIQNFGEDKANAVLDAIRFEKPDDVTMLVPHLVNIGYIQKAQVLLTRFTTLTEKPNWWNREKKTQLIHELLWVMKTRFYLYRVLHGEELLSRAEIAQAMVTALLQQEPPIDFSQRSRHAPHRTVLQVASDQDIPPGITAALLERSPEEQLLETNEKNETALQLFLKSSQLDPCHPKILTFFKKFNFLEEDLTHVVEEAERLQASKGQALLDYVTSQNEFLRAILKPPVKRTKSEATDLFFQVAAAPISNKEKDELLKNLLPLLDITRREKSSPHETLFHIIAKNHLGTHYTDELLTNEEQFYEKNDTGISTLGALLEHNAIRLDHPVLQRFLEAVDIKRARTTQTLWTYLRHDNGFWQTSGTIASKIAVAYLINDKTRFTDLCTVCATNTQTRNEVLKELAPLGATAIEALLLDSSFTMNRAHLVLPPPVVLPDKPANTKVEDIRTLYEKYTADTGGQKQRNSASLKIFEDRFNRRAFFGGPATETELYANIDKATCNVIAHFKRRITALDPQNPNPDVQSMAQNGNRAARELLSDMHVWFLDCINAAEMCAPRIYNNAVTNYMKYVLHKQTDTFKDMLYDVLAEKRSEAITGLFNDQQSIHYATLFLHDYARALAIPGYEIYESREDLFVLDPNTHRALPQYRTKVDAAKVTFEKMYPHLAVDAVRDAFLASRDFYEKFMVYLKAKAGQNADAQAARALLREISILWYKAKTPQEKQEVVNQYLQRHSLTITDTSSLQSIERELMSMVNEQEKTLYISSVQELMSNGKMQFTTETILTALHDLEVLS